MKRVAQLTIVLSAMLLFPPLTHAGEKVNYYSLQVKDLPLTQQKQGLEVYETLKKAGYMVYYYSANVSGRDWLKVRVGSFAEKGQAKQIGEQLKKTAGIAYWIDKTEVFIDSVKNQVDIITTPSAVWWKTKDGLKELYKFGNISGLDFLDYTQAVISPSGKEIVFYYDHKLIKVAIDSGASEVLVKEGLLNSRPRWSTDGQYIGYLDYSEWETPTSLCIVTVASSQTNCLVKHDDKTQKAVKSFQWHPRKNVLFFVEGHAYGTVSVGGNLYSVDPAGNRKEVVVAKVDNQEEISSEFSIEGDQLNYKVIQFDKNYAKQLANTPQQLKIE